MIRWLWKIIVGKKPRPPCTRECQWETLREGELSKWVSREQSWVTFGWQAELRCKTCGDMKTHRSDAR